MALFQNRREAGRALAGHLERYARREDVVVLALPRGGVPVGFEVARRLGAPLDVLVVRKLGAPGNPELAVGAIAPQDVRLLVPSTIEALGVGREELDRLISAESRELQRREQAYRGGRPPPPIQDRIAILVDDGLATGASMTAAARATRRLAPSRIVIAVPVAAPQVCAALEGEADEVVCVATPAEFLAVSSAYADFSQTSDDEVRSLLQNFYGSSMGRAPRTG